MTPAGELQWVCLYQATMKHESEKKNTPFLGYCWSQKQFQVLLHYVNDLLAHCQQPPDPRLLIALVDYKLCVLLDILGVCGISEATCVRKCLSESSKFRTFSVSKLM